MSDCHSDTPWVGECLPLRKDETVALIIDVATRARQLSAVDASVVESAAVQVLTEGLQAPGTGQERARVDVKVTPQTTSDFATFAWEPEDFETTMTVFLQCSIDDIPSGAAGNATQSLTCQMTRGRMKMAAGWMTGYQDYGGAPVVGLLTGRADGDAAVLRTLLRQVFRKTIYVSRLAH